MLLQRHVTRSLIELLLQPCILLLQELQLLQLLSLLQLPAFAESILLCYNSL